MTVPFSFDEVVAAIAATRGDGAHFYLLGYLTRHQRDVGPERFHRLLDAAELRSKDRNRVHVTLADLDPTYAPRLVDVLLSTRSLNAQQELLISLPDVLPRAADESTAAKLEDWLQRRVRRPSYVEFGASWEVPAVILCVLRTSSVARTRALLDKVREYFDDIDDGDAAVIRAVLGSSDDDLESRLEHWLRGDRSTYEYSPDELAALCADWDREVVRYMRRLGFAPSTST